MFDLAIEGAELAAHVGLAFLPVGSDVVIAAELLHFGDGVVGDGAHDRAGFEGLFLFFAVMLHLELRRPALATDFVELFVDDVVRVAFLFEVHRAGKARRAGADDTNPIFVVWHMFLHLIG